MPTCLLGLGSNLGNRQATLRAAIAEIDALPDVRLRKHSELNRSRAIGGPADQAEYLNIAATIETTTASLILLSELQDIEVRHGRQRDQSAHSERWGPRTLDIDVLLYGNEVSETEMLTLPHPRMSFRRFVLEPAAEIAPRMLHPVIGWPVERLLLHLNAASNQLAVLSPSETVRRQIADAIVQKFGAVTIDSPTFPTADEFWPPAVAAWIGFPAPTDVIDSEVSKRGGLRYAAAAFPKLTILLDAGNEPTGIIKSQWSAIARKPGRGPTLRIQSVDPATIQAEVFAAIESVWPT